MKKAIFIGGMFCLILITALSFSGKQGNAQSLAQADRQRIENYGAQFVRAINAGTAEAQTKAVPEVFAQSLIQGTSEARLAGLFA